jgi:hypothetical protein
VKERKQLMSKRYPPIFNVILFAVAVCVILANPMTMLMPWISTVTNLIVFAVSSIFNAVGYVYDRYTVFALHVVIIALYAKQLFGKEAKAKYLEAIELVESNKNLDNYDEYHEVRDNLVDVLTPLYVESILVLIIIVLNTIFPNFYQFTLLQASCESGVDVVGDITVLTFIQPMMITLIFGTTMMIGLVLAYFKADSILTSKLRSEAGE